MAKFLIVEARFYAEISDLLYKGASEALRNAGVAFERIAVPGALEIPAVISIAHQGASPKFDGYIALGCVIRGQTDHYDHICREASRALMDIAVQDGVALGFGILTCPSYELAMERAAVEKKNKGAEAARACLAMMALDHALDGLLR